VLLVLDDQDARVHTARHTAPVLTGT